MIDLLDPDEMRLWVCPLDGESPEIGTGEWRMAGDHWQHHHGYPLNHEPAIRVTTKEQAALLSWNLRLHGDTRHRQP